jgi:hypothetical protein
MAVDVGSDEVVHESEAYDANEPTYCICDRPSFGEMIGKFIILSDSFIL